MHLLQICQRDLVNALRMGPSQLGGSLFSTGPACRCTSGHITGIIITLASTILNIDAILFQVLQQVFCQIFPSIASDVYES